MSGSADRPAIIVVSSHVVRGSVGNRAAVFALEVLGHPVWALPTIVLPWHPGHGPATRIVPPADAFAKLVDDLRRAPWLGEVGAVLSGYLGSANQASPIASLVETVRARNPDCLYACDPVIGDESGLYVGEATARAIADTLVPIADIVTPNRFELAWLAGAGKLDTNEAIIDAAAVLGRPMALVTSAIAMMRQSTGNLLVSSEGAMAAEHRSVDAPPNGLGDLTAAVFLSRLLQGHEPERALKDATASVFEILARTVKRGADELMLETDQASLKNPMAMVQMRRIVHGPAGGGPDAA